MRFYGRAGRTNVRLGEGEIARLYARREQWQVDRRAGARRRKHSGSGPESGRLPGEGLVGGEVRWSRVERGPRERAVQPLRLAKEIASPAEVSDPRPTASRPTPVTAGRRGHLSVRGHDAGGCAGDKVALASWRCSDRRRLPDIPWLPRRAERPVGLRSARRIRRRRNRYRVDAVLPNRYKTVGRNRSSSGGGSSPPPGTLAQRTVRRHCFASAATCGVMARIGKWRSLRP